MGYHAVNASLFGLLMLWGINLVGFIPMPAQPYNKLSKEEQKIILQKGTEAPFSGEYNDFFESGTYNCKKCDALLFDSTNKFSSSCGWPSFDDEIKGAIRRQRDADGKRMEILCARCDGHLGHVFEGEEFTKKNIRHCVNSISLVFKPAQKDINQKVAYFAGGCFWGVEHLFEQKKGVISAVSGYMGGKKEKPSYSDISKGDTGHFEAVKVSYHSDVVSYEELSKFFFEIHDPTQADGQGPDIGEQYLSVIFYGDEDEKKVAHHLLDILQLKGYQAVTKVLRISTFWQAEESHQNYYSREKKTPYCHSYKKKF